MAELNQVLFPLWQFTPILAAARRGALLMRRAAAVNPDHGVLTDPVRAPRAVFDRSNVAHG